MIYSSLSKMFDTFSDTLFIIMTNTIFFKNLKKKIKQYGRISFFRKVPQIFQTKTPKK